jgi:hypothetical protein
MFLIFYSMSLFNAYLHWCLQNALRPWYLIRVAVIAVVRPLLYVYFLSVFANKYSNEDIVSAFENLLRSCSLSWYVVGRFVLIANDLLQYDHFTKVFIIKTFSVACLRLLLLKRHHLLSTMKCSRHVKHAPIQTVLAQTVFLRRV